MLAGRRGRAATPRSTTPSCTTTTSRATRAAAGASWASAHLTRDLRRGALPAFAFVSPDLCHDTHDCDVATGDRFLSGLVPQLLRELGPRGFLVLTWDEGSSDAGCCTDAHGGRIATIVAGPGARRGVRSARPVDHYGVLHTVQSELGLAPLGGAARPRSGTLDALLAHARVAR